MDLKFEVEELLDMRPQIDKIRKRTWKSSRQTGAIHKQLRPVFDALRNFDETWRDHLREVTANGQGFSEEEIKKHPEKVKASTNYRAGIAKETIEFTVEPKISWDQIDEINKPRKVDKVNDNGDKVTEEEPPKNPVDGEELEALMRLGLIADDGEE